MDVYYVLAGALVLAALVFRVVRGDSTPFGGGAVIAGVFLMLYPFLEGYFLRGSEVLTISVERLDAAYRCFVNSTATATAHVTFAVSTAATLAFTMGVLTGGISTVLASLAISAALDAYHAFIMALASWFGLGASMLAVAASAAKIAPALFAALAPVAAFMMPSRSAAYTMFVAAASPYIIVAAVAAFVPPLLPMPSCPASTLPTPTSGGVIGAHISPEGAPPAVVVVKTQHGDATVRHYVTAPGWWHLPPGNYTVEAVIWMWILTEARPQNFTVRPQLPTAQNATLHNITLYVVAYRPQQNVTAYVPQYDYYHGWTYASTPAPRGATTLNDTAAYFYDVVYECYGYASECAKSEYIRAVGLLGRVYIEVLSQKGPLEVKHSVAISTLHTVPRELWQEICNASADIKLGENFVLRQMCPDHKVPSAADIYIHFQPAPDTVCEVEGNSTECREVPAFRHARVRVYVTIQEFADPPVVAAYAIYRNGSKFTSRDAIGLIHYVLYGKYSPLAEVLLTPVVAWIHLALIPFVLKLVHSIILVTGVAAGIGAVIAASGVVAGRDFPLGYIAKMKYAYDPTRRALTAMRQLALTRAHSRAPSAPVADQVSEKTTQRLADPTVRTTQRGWLAAATAARAAQLAYSFDTTYLFLLPPSYLYMYFFLRRKEHAARIRAAAKAAYYLLSPSGHEEARKVQHVVETAIAAAHLRVDEVLAGTLGIRLKEAYEANLQYGSRELALLLALRYLRKATPHEAAALALVYNIPTQYFYVDPELLRREVVQLAAELYIWHEVETRWLYASIEDVTAAWLQRSGDTTPLKIYRDLGYTVEEAARHALYFPIAPGEYRRQVLEAWSLQQFLPVVKAAIELGREAAEDLKALSELAALGRVEPTLEELLKEAESAVTKLLGIKPELYQKYQEVRNLYGFEAWIAAAELVVEAKKTLAELEYAPKLYDVYFHKGVLYVTYGSKYPESVVVDTAKRLNLPLAGPAAEEIARSHGLSVVDSPVYVEDKKVEVDPKFLAWRNYSISVGPEEVEVNFGGDADIWEVITTLSIYDGREIVGDAAPYVKRLMESPSAVAEALVELELRRQTEETAQTLGILDTLPLLPARHEEERLQSLEERLGQVGIELPREVVVQYFSKYGEEAFDRLVEEAARLIAAAYKLPSDLVPEVAEHIKKYGMESATRLASHVVKEARQTGEDVREIWRRFTQ